MNNKYKRKNTEENEEEDRANKGMEIINQGKQESGLKKAKEKSLIIHA